MKTPTQDAVAERAYHLWLDEGSPHGRDIGFWLEAEKQLKADADKSDDAKSKTAKSPNAKNGESDGTMKERLTGEMASESAIENQISPAPSDQEAIRAALQKKEARAPQVPHKTAPNVTPPQSGKPIWPKPHSS